MTRQEGRTFLTKANGREILVFEDLIQNADQEAHALLILILSRLVKQTMQSLHAAA